MAKNLDPKCKQCRREGEKLFLKGDRCNSPKCAMVKKIIRRESTEQRGEAGKAIIACSCARNKKLKNCIIYWKNNLR